MAEVTSANQAAIGRMLNNYKLTPATLAHKLSGGAWIPTDWLMYASREIAAEIAKGNGRLIVSVPPRHGKSELLSKYLPIWHLEKWPEKHVVVTAYGADLATDFTRASRDIIKCNQDLLTIRLQTEKEENWLTTKGGSCRGIGLGGPIMGRGAHLLLIDDFIKEYKDAVSEAHREYVWNWFLTTALTRLEPGATIIIIATRWHPDDLIGRVIDRLGGRWRYIRIPAISEGPDGPMPDPLGRPIGAPLFPERYDLDALDERKTAMGFLFDAVYQQDPKTLSSGMVDADWLTKKVIDELPDNQEGLQFARIWDFSGGKKAKKKRDWTTGTLMAYDPKTERAYICEVIRVKLTSMRLEEKVKQTANNDGRRVKIYIEREPGSAGIHLIAHYQEKVLKGYLTEELVSSDAKEARVQPFLAAAQAGKVYLLKADWNDAFLAEFGAFPDGTHDDQVDGAAWAYLKLSGKKPFSLTWGRENDKEKLLLPNSALAALEQSKRKQLVTGATWGGRRH